MLIREVLSGRWKLLLLVSAVAIVVPPEAAGPFKLPYFLLCGFALIPLAQITAELVIALTALKSGLYDLVVLSIAGAVITNSLLVLGISTIVAGRRELVVDLNRHSRGLSTRQLLISVILMSVPSIFFWDSMHPITEGSNVFDLFAVYSLVVAVIVMLAYLLSYLYQLGTHRGLFAVERELAEASATSESQASLLAIVGVLVLVALAIAGVSEHLVAGLEDLVKGSAVTPPICGHVVVAVVFCNSRSAGRLSGGQSRSHGPGDGQHRRIQCPVDVVRIARPGAARTANGAFPTPHLPAPGPCLPWGHRLCRALGDGRGFSDLVPGFAAAQHLYGPIRGCFVAQTHHLNCSSEGVPALGLWWKGLAEAG